MKSFSVLVPWNFWSMQEFRRHWWLVLVICGAACLARVGMLGWKSDLLFVDVDAYLEIARHLANGEGFAKDQPPHLTAYRPPLYPLLIAAIFQLGSSPIKLGVAQVLLGTLTVGLTLRAGQLLRLGAASLLAAVLVACDPLLLQYTALPMTETLCSTLVILWCWVVLEFPANPPSGSSPPVWCPLLHGACFGLICLCRPGFLAAVGLFAAWTLLGLATGRTNLRRAFQITAWSAVGLMVVLAPWMLRNALIMGKATPATTHGGYTLLLANNPVFYREVVSQPWGTTWQGDSLNRWQQELEVQLSDDGIRPDDEVARDRWMYRRAISHIQTEPALFVRACLWRALRFWDLAPWTKPSGYSPILVWGTAIFYGVVSGGILISLCRLTRVEWKQWGILLLLPLTLWLTHWVYWTDMRMRAPVIPILALLAARACVRPTDHPPL